MSGGKELLAGIEAAAAALHDRTTGEGQVATALWPGVGSGLALSAVEEAHAAKRGDQPYVWITSSLTSDGVRAALDAQAVVLIRDGREDRTLRAACAALGRPAVVIDRARLATLAGAEVLTVDGTRGVVLAGEAAVDPGSVPPDLRERLLALAEVAPLEVVAEASTLPATLRGVALGADALRIDLDAVLVCSPLLETLQAYLLASTAHVRQARLVELTALVRRECAGLFTAVDDLLATTVALAGRQPESFFPTRPEAIADLADRCGVSLRAVRSQLESMRAGNSKLGLRGVRWVLEDVQLFAALSRGVFEAAVEVAEALGGEARVGLLLGAVSFPGELKAARAELERVRAEVALDFGCSLTVRYGAGIEAMRGVLELREIAAAADFVEYDLHGMTESLFGLSRDDARAFLPQMLEVGLFPADPFREVDPVVARAVALAQGLVGDRRRPAGLRGRQTMRASALRLLRATGIERISVPADLVLRARIRHVGALLASHGFERDSGLDPLRALARDPVSMLTSRMPGAVPEGVPPLQFLEDLVGRVEAGELTPHDVLLRVPPGIVDSVARPLLDPRGIAPASVGIGASPGCGLGRVALSAAKAEGYREEGEPYVLVIHEVYGEEAGAVRGARGLVSVRGGSTSHAAMVAANSGVPCVIDETVQIDLANGRASFGGSAVAEGEWLSLDGSTGAIYSGAVPLIEGASSEAFGALMRWADEARRLKVKANADTPDEARMALEAGASAIGLVRTEHMFFGKERLESLRAVILQEPGAASAALARLEALQREDFVTWFETVGDASVTFRLLDAPLYEFLPQRRDELEVLAEGLGVDLREAARRVDAQQPCDSLMAMRALRLSVVRPEIERAQVRALATAWAEVCASGVALAPLQLMLPMVSGGAELSAGIARVRARVEEVAAECGIEIPLEFSAMMELPRAVFEAGEMAEQVGRFAWGTNDLTQFTLGLGRNVARQFLPSLLSVGALESDPTETLDAGGVGRLIRIGDALGRGARPDLEMGVCGRHGAEPRSIRMLHRLGLDYVSVPAAQIVGARLAAAQAALLEG